MTKNHVIINKLIKSLKQALGAQSTMNLVQNLKEGPENISGEFQAVIS